MLIFKCVLASAPLQYRACIAQMLEFYRISRFFLNAHLESFLLHIGLFRTHIGSSTSPVDAQVYDSAESMAHFAEFAGVFGQLKDYRLELMREAAETGHPLVR